MEILIAPILLSQFIEKVAEHFNISIDEATTKVLESKTFEQMQSKYTTLPTYQPNDLLDEFLRRG